MSFPIVTVVVLNWRTVDVTLRCIDSLIAQGDESLKIVVVDNGSEDGSIERLREYGRGITVIDSGANLGYGGGNNLGIRHGLQNRSDWIWILNNDTIVAPDCLAHLLAGSSQGENKVYVPTIAVGGTNGLLWYAGGHLDMKRGEVRHWGWLRPTREDCDDTPLTFATGCSVLVPSKAFEELGLLCEDYFLYWEDAEFSRRLQRGGYEITYVPRARVDHWVGSSSGASSGISATSCYYGTRNRLWFVRTLPALERLSPFVWTIPLLAREAIRIRRRGADGRDCYVALVRGLRDGLVLRPRRLAAKERKQMRSAFQGSSGASAGARKENSVR